MGTLVSLLAVAFSFWAGADSPTRQPVPDDVSQKAAVKLVAEVYKADYDSANTPEQKAALAKRLLGEGVATKDDPAGKFVLLRIAKDIATQQGDLNTAFGAVDQIARY